MPPTRAEIAPVGDPARYRTGLGRLCLDFVATAATPAPAVRAAGFGRCCLESRRFDGAMRSEYFR